MNEETKLERRTLMGALLAALVFHRGWADASELAPAPEGFRWDRVETLKSWFVVPEGWHFSEEAHCGSQTVYFSKFPRVSPDAFATQFAINVVPNMDTKGASITTWCKAFVSVCLEGQKPLELWTDEEGPLAQFCVEKIDPPTSGRPARRIRILGVANTSTNTLYLVQFECAADEWDEEWRKARVIYGMLNLNRSL